MSPFGIGALIFALVHDLSMRSNQHDPVLWPYALIALSFYVGLDIVFAEIADALKEFKQRK